MGKKRLDIKRRPTAAKRYSTYMKRKAGINKKAKQLSTLCATKLALLTFSPKGQANLVLGENSELAEVLEMFSKVTIKERQKRSRETLKSLRRSYIKAGQEFDMEKLTPPGPEMAEECRKYIKEFQEKIDEVNMKLRAYRNPYSVTDKKQILAMEERLQKSLEALRRRKQRLLEEKAQQEAATLEDRLEEIYPLKKPTALEVNPADPQVLVGETNTQIYPADLEAHLGEILANKSTAYFTGRFKDNLAYKNTNYLQGLFGENLAYKNTTYLEVQLQEEYAHNELSKLQGYFGENLAFKNTTYLEGCFGENLASKNTTYLEAQLQEEYAHNELSKLQQNGLPSSNMTNDYQQYMELLQHGIPLSGPYAQPHTNQFMGLTEMNGIGSSLYPFGQMGYNLNWSNLNSTLPGLNFQLQESSSYNPSGFNVGGVYPNSGFNVGGVDPYSAFNMGGLNPNSSFKVGVYPNSGFNVGGFYPNSSFTVGEVYPNSAFNGGEVYLNSGFNMGGVDLNSSMLIKQDDQPNSTMPIKQNDYPNPSMLIKQDDIDGSFWIDYLSSNP